MIVSRPPARSKAARSRLAHAGIPDLNCSSSSWKGSTSPSAGSTSTGKTSTGSPFRGLLLAEVPAPLDKLGLFPGMVITAVNGAPVADCAGLLSLLQRAAPNTRSYLVEYVAPDKQLCAIEYRRR